MLRMLLSIVSMLAACTPSQKATMPGPSPVSGIATQSSSTSSPGKDDSIGPRPSGQTAGDAGPRAAAATSAPGPIADSPAEAAGRRILSTAFVRVGPDGRLTVELRGGGVVALRDVVMRPRDYCGVPVAGDRTKYCGGYAEVVAARPGVTPAPD